MRTTIFEPLGMNNSCFTAEAIEAAPNHSQGHRWTPSGTIEVPFTPIFPYALGGAGAIDSSLTDLVRMGALASRQRHVRGARDRLGSKSRGHQNPRVSVSETLFYAMGWLVQATPGGNISGTMVGRFPSAPISAWLPTRMSA